MVATLDDVRVASPRTGVTVVSFGGEHDMATSELTSELLDSLLLTNDLVVADVFPGFVLRAVRTRGKTEAESEAAFRFPAASAATPGFGAPTWGGPG